MTYRQAVLIAIASIGVFCHPAPAREADGTLGLIQVPNNGVPVIVTPGETFNATVTEKTTLTLVNETDEWPLTTTWAVLPGGGYRAACETSDALPVGAYALRATTNDRENTNTRAVFVMECLPKEYLVVHITDTHIGSTRHPRDADAIMADVIAAANASEAAFVLVTGDITENGTAEQFRQFIELLDTSRLPTFVVPGNHDRKGRNYEAFFGPRTYKFWFGEDGYLGFDTKDFFIADGMDEQDGRLHYYRRQIRPARWSVGFTHRYDVTMGMRAQLTLFVDDPLDYLIYGHYHREATGQDGIPWGRTAIIMTPAAINGKLRFIKVDAQGLHPQETVAAATVQEAPTTEEPAE